MEDSCPEPLPRREAAVLAALASARGRVLSRAELARAAGLEQLSARRVDGVLVRLRKALPAGALLTVRGRGWALSAPSSAPGVHQLGTSRKHAGRSAETPPA